MFRSRRHLTAIGVLLVAGCSGKPVVNSIAISSPSGTAYTNATVNIQVAATGSVDTVILLDGTAQIASISSPFSFDWSTTGLPEGDHVIVARSGSLKSAPVTIVVDRTAPTIIGRNPAPGADQVSSSDPIVVTFSEPILATSVDAVSLTVDDDLGNPIGATTAVGHQEQGTHRSGFSVEVIK